MKQLGEIGPDGKPMASQFLPLRYNAAIELTATIEPQDDVLPFELPAQTSAKQRQSAAVFSWHSLAIAVIWRIPSAALGKTPWMPQRAGLTLSATSMLSIVITALHRTPLS